jgi:hypothetical protein
MGFWVMTPCNLVGYYPDLEGNFCLHLQDTCPLTRLRGSQTRLEQSNVHVSENLGYPTVEMHWLCFLKELIELIEISKSRKSERHEDTIAFLSIISHNYITENWQFIITYFLEYSKSLFHILTTIYIFQIYYIYYGMEVVSLSVSGVDLYIIIKLTTLYFNILPWLIRRSATQIYGHKHCLQKV